MQQPFTSPSKPVFEMLTIDLAPGAAVPAHSHPVPVFAYVLQGELITRIGSAPEETLKPGQTYYLPAGVIHYEARNPSSTEHTKLLSIEVAPEGKPLVLPASKRSGSPPMSVLTPSSELQASLVQGLRPNNRLIILAGDPKPLQLSAAWLITGRKSLAYRLSRNSSRLPVDR